MKTLKLQEPNVDVLSEEEVEEQMMQFHQSIDKFVYVAFMLAAGFPLPAEFVGSEFDTKDALKQLIPHVEELEKVITQPNYPMNYMGYDLKSYGVVLTRVLMDPKFAQHIKEDLDEVYQKNSEVTSGMRCWNLNWDRCLSLKYHNPEVGRNALPLFSKILRAIEEGNEDFYNQPYLAINTLIDFENSKVMDIGADFRNILRDEEAGMSAKNRKQQQAVKPTATTSMPETTEETTVAKESQESTNTDWYKVDENGTVTIEESTAQELKDAFNESLFEEMEKMTKADKAKIQEKVLKNPKAAAKILDVVEELGADEMSAEEKAQLKKVKEALESVGDLDLDTLDVSESATESSSGKRVSWTSNEWTTGEKILVGAAGAAAVGAIGYGIYRYLNRDDTQYASGIALDALTQSSIGF